MIWGNKVIKKITNITSLSQLFLSFRDKKTNYSIFNHIVSAKAAKSSYLICYRMLLKKAQIGFTSFFFDIFVVLQ